MSTMMAMEARLTGDTRDGSTRRTREFEHSYAGISPIRGSQRTTSNAASERGLILLKPTDRHRRIIKP